MSALNAGGRITVKISGARGPYGVTIVGTPAPGEYLVWNADRKVQGATGTGADAGLRTDLGASDGALISGYAHPVLPDTPRSVGSWMADRSISVKDAGAVLDRDTDDAEAIQASLDGAATYDQYPAAVFLPAGHANIETTLLIDQQATIVGEGTSSLINCQGKDFDAPLFANKNPYGLINGQFRDMGGYGGTHFLKLDAATENAEIQLTNVVALLQTEAAIEVNQLFQSCKLWNCTIGSAPYGLKVTGSGLNSVYSLGTVWNSLAECTIYSRGAQCLTVIGGRMEGAGATGKNTLDIENADTVSLQGVYFENTGEFLLRARNIRDAVVFEKSHFSGTSAGAAPIGGNGLRPYQWDCPEDVQVTFRDCYSDVPMLAPPNCRLEGRCVNIFPSNAVYSGNDWHGAVKAKSRAVPASLVVELLRFTRASSGSIVNVQAIGGPLLLTYAGIGPAPSGVARDLARKYDVLISAYQTYPMIGHLAQDGSDMGSLNGPSMDVVVASAIATASTTNASPTIDITEATFGEIAVGDKVVGTGIPAGATILAFGSGSGGVGTYVLSAAATATGSVQVLTSSPLSMSIVALFDDIDPATENASQLGWSFDWDRSEGDPSVGMSVIVPLPV